jgi:AbrB family looped-hinge helix DNA binding protein
MATSTLTSKGQITLPKAVREHLHLVAGDEIEFAIADDGSVTVAARRRSAADLYGFLRRADRRKKPVEVSEMNESIAEVISQDDERIRRQR